MLRSLLLLFLCMQCYGQKVHHQMIATQGKNVKLSNHFFVAQSVGQSSVIGNFKSNNLIVGQGYIQSYGVSKDASPVVNTVAMIEYPNPVIDVANFQFSSFIGTTVNFSLFDDRGRLVYSQQTELSQNNFGIDLSMLSEGLYFATISNSNYTFSTKILKSK